MSQKRGLCVGHTGVVQKRLNQSWAGLGCEFVCNRRNRVLFGGPDDRQKGTILRGETLAGPVATNLLNSHLCAAVAAHCSTLPSTSACCSHCKKYPHIQGCFVWVFHILTEHKIFVDMRIYLQSSAHSERVPPQDVWRQCGLLPNCF